MKRWIVLLSMIAIVTVGGCGQKPIAEEKQASFDRWCRARARIICGLAEQELKAGRLREARKKADEAVDLAPEFADARIVLGRIRIEQGAYVSAIRELREACKLDPESTQAEYFLGIALEKGDRIDDAISAYKKAYELDDRNIDAVMAVGEVLASNERCDEANRYIQKFLADNGGRTAMVELAARLAMSCRQFELAAKHYQALVRRNADNVQWQEGLGRAYFAAGQYEKSIGALEIRSTLKEPAAPAWVYAMLGDCYMALSRVNRARLTYAEALARKPSSAELTVKMAQAYLVMGDNASSGRIARRALELAPGDLDAMLVLGYSLLRSKKPRDAGDVLEPAAVLYPRNVALLCLLGRCHAAVGDSDRAKECYLQAVKVDPDCELAKNLLKSIERIAVSGSP